MMWNAHGELLMPNFSCSTLEVSSESSQNQKLNRHWILMRLGAYRIADGENEKKYHSLQCRGELSYCKRDQKTARQREKAAEL
jgi:hypothetical protein